MRQMEGESLTEFMERVKGAANKCQLGDEYDLWVALFIVGGIYKEELRRRILEFPEMTLTGVETVFLRAEAAEWTLKEFKGGRKSGGGASEGYWGHR